MKKVKKLSLTMTLITAALLVFAIFAGCAGGARPVAWEPGRAYELILLHTNDHHGRILPMNGVGGLAERATFVNSVRAAHPQVLLVDAGDINTGTALSNMFEAYADIQAYNLIGYDAVTFGNHEFNKGSGRLNRQLSQATFPWVSSNVTTGRNRFLGGNQYLVKDFDGFRVGIIGLTTLRTLAVSNPGPAYTFLPEIDAARAAVNRLINRERADIIIAITHMGTVREDAEHVTVLELAAAVPEIDIIVDGHTHANMTEPLRVGNTWIVSAHQWGLQVGQGRLTVVNGNLVGFDWQPVEIRGFEPDPVLSAFLAPFIRQGEESLRQVVGYASDTFVFGNRLTRYQETSLGNMICDANVWYFREVANLELDFAFHNGGNMRTELPAGPITREQILTILPFDNFLYIVSMRGSDLIELFNFMATIPQGAGGFPQFSREVRYTLDVPNQRISNITIGGAPIDPNRIYRFCTNDFLLSGGDGYTVLSRAQSPFNTSLLLSYVVMQYISYRGTITPSYDGRLTVIGGRTP